MTRYQADITLECWGGSDEFLVREFSLSPAGDSKQIGRSSRRHTSRCPPSFDNACFSSPVVSREHAKLCFDYDTKDLTITDVGSLHGTLVNGTRIKKHTRVKLTKGTRITLGSTVINGPKSFPAREFHIDWTCRPYIERDELAELTETNELVVESFPVKTAERDINLDVVFIPRQTVEPNQRYKTEAQIPSGTFKVPDSDSDSDFDDSDLEGNVDLEKEDCDEEPEKGTTEEQNARHAAVEDSEEEDEPSVEAEAKRSRLPEPNPVTVCDNISNHNFVVLISDDESSDDSDNFMEVSNKAAPSEAISLGNEDLGPVEISEKADTMLVSPVELLVSESKEPSPIILNAATLTPKSYTSQASACGSLRQVQSPGPASQSEFSPSSPTWAVMTPISSDAVTKQLQDDQIDERVELLPVDCNGTTSRSIGFMKPGTKDILGRATDDKERDLQGEPSCSSGDISAYMDSSLYNGPFPFPKHHWSGRSDSPVNTPIPHRTFSGPDVVEIGHGACESGKRATQTAAIWNSSRSLCRMTSDAFMDIDRRRHECIERHDQGTLQHGSNESDPEFDWSEIFAANHDQSSHCSSPFLDGCGSSRTIHSKPSAKNEALNMTEPTSNLAAKIASQPSYDATPTTAEKTGISIQILTQDSSNNIYSSTNRKRKINQITLEAPNVPVSEARDDDSFGLPTQEVNSTLGVQIELLETQSPSFVAETEERPSKRTKIIPTNRFLLGTLTGAIAMLGAILWLPAE